ncbi:MAG: GntR family transcriptional regulator [Pseudomonadota bacterium]
MSRFARLPRYQQLAEKIRSEILSGEYAFGSRLPSELELCQTHGVSRGTVVKAFDLLVNEGLAVRKQGAGTFVARASLRRQPGRLLSFSETIAAQGKRAEQRVLSVSEVHDVQGKSVGCFEPAIRIVRLRYVDGVASSLHNSVVPVAVLNRFSKADIAALHEPGVSDFSLYAAFSRAGVGIARAQETVNARLGTAEEAAVLAVPLPMAVMLIGRQSFDADGRLIEAAEAIYHGDYYTCENTLSRGAKAVQLRVRDGTATGEAADDEAARIH